MSPIVPDLDEWFEIRHGFPRADWDLIEDHILCSVEERGLDEAWSTAAKHWLTRVAIRCGAQLAESHHFYLLTFHGAEDCSRVLEAAENAYSRLCTYLEVRSNQHYGKIPILRFVDSATYYSYVAEFYEAGKDIPTSMGVFINQGFPHIVCLTLDEKELVPTIAHELAHSLTYHLPLPTWVSEGFAMMMTYEAGAEKQAATEESRRKHREFWNCDTIQLFWFGEIFSHPDDARDLGVWLSDDLFDVIQTELNAPADAIHAFLEHVSCDDAGASAARKYLRADLGELVEVLLGPGEWRPIIHPKTWTHIPTPLFPRDRE